MSETIDLTLENKLDVTERRTLIQQEIRANPGRSDREIARGIGCDHKTVGSVRKNLEALFAEHSPPISPPEPTATVRRQMLINGVADFDRKSSPETSEQIVDRAVAEDKVSLMPPDNDDFEEFSWEDNDDVAVCEQAMTAIYFNPSGSLVIRQHRWPGDDDIVIITKPCVDGFIDQLCDRLGIPSVGRP